MKYDAKNKSMDYTNKELSHIHGGKFGSNKRTEAIKKAKVGKVTTPRDMSRRAAMMQRHPELKKSDFEGGWSKNK